MSACPQSLGVVGKTLLDALYGQTEEDVIGKKGSSTSKLCLSNLFAFAIRRPGAQRDNSDERVP